ncbi:MAG: cytochrome P450 [Mycobacterium kyogaense]|uniref:cytochrome P450 n=1 Tax=Mycobacterium kyogaense TaxID=2212479 RepID=UPI002FF9D47E
MSTTLVRQARRGAAKLADHVPSPVRPLAEPPAESGLEPVLGSQGLPVLGHVLQFLSDPITMTRNRYAAFGPVSWGGFLATRVVWVMGPEAIAEVLNNRDKAFANGPGWDYFIGPFFHRGLMLLDFEEHLHHKEIMQQAFTPARLRGYLDTINPRIEKAIAGWESGSSFPLYDETKQLLLDVATEVFVGAELGEDADRLNKAFIDTVVAGQAYVRADIPGGAWHRGIQGRRLLERYFREQMPAKRGSDDNDLFSVLCRMRSENADSFSDEDIVNHMIFLLMAAHDTSTITAAMMAYYLAQHPEWQDRARAESRALGKSVADFDDLAELTLLDQIFKETLRLNPPVGLVFRQTVKDTSILGRFIPAKTRIALPFYGNQYLERGWKDARVFDPDRFSPQRAEDKSHRFLWTPFGGGVHKCIGLYFGGMEVKAILHQLLLNFRWSLEPGYELPMDYGTGLHPADGLPVRLERLED